MSYHVSVNRHSNLECRFYLRNEVMLLRPAVGGVREDVLYSYSRISMVQPIEGCLPEMS